MWQIIQTPKGQIISGGERISYYQDNRWEFVPGLRKSAIRSLLVDGDTLWIASLNEIGRLKLPLNRDSHYEYLPTWDLMRRLRNPSFSSRSLRSQNMFVQARLTKPLLNLVVVAVGVPFVVRRESVSVLTNLAVCCGVMTAMLGVNETYLYLGKANILAPEVAVWAPIITWGTAAAWLSGMVRT